MRSRFRWIMLALTAAMLLSCRRPTATAPAAIPTISSLVAFTNDVRTSPPWSIYIARISRGPGVEVHSVHAMNGALGLTPLSEQVRSLRPDLGAPLAAVNGDFYQRERAYAGDPRGLQIVEGQLVSAPAGTTSFWTDDAGMPHVGTVQSLFAVTWPNGKKTAIGLNEERRADNAVLFTPAVGSSTRTMGGTDVILRRHENDAWLPLRAGETMGAVVAEVHQGGDAPLLDGMLVLSIGPEVMRFLGPVAPGAVLKISTATSPDLRGARTAISGGPLLIQGSKPMKIDPTGLFDPSSYSARSMKEEHPRTAFGWNAQFFYFVEVDGRQRGSVGMTLEQVRDYMLGLGCTDAMNLDGGGSATLWCNGAVMNHPCDGRERPIANGLVATQKGIESARR